MAACCTLSSLSSTTLIAAVYFPVCCGGLRRETRRDSGFGVGCSGCEICQGSEFVVDVVVQFGVLRRCCGMCSLAAVNFSGELGSPFSSMEGEGNISDKLADENMAEPSTVSARKKDEEGENGGENSK
ncbi:hypothetical protein Tsubulata_005873 [Turnera subulata]|uniref:Secreted protein n=1 Tax=Turnera subulata TaxID=218843 RepID=A0A9Q0G4L5_9ROSI|nr:hypothetical protein Tsubulata_005873 [Turnera subulata]